MFIDSKEISVDRRHFVYGGAAAFSAIAAALAGAGSPTRAQTYRADEGKELAPGVRAVELGKGAAMIPGYKTVSLIDLVFQPQSNLPVSAMPNAMICHITEGELMLLQDGKEFQAKKNHVWTCAEGRRRALATTQAHLRLCGLPTC
ncbi:hypothetical protein [Rhizobium mongolense]|uniref:Secreted protein n=2 Tax=Rhizobium mongolense TaxID=57676 RepID=A0ABR6IER7_9HYPH|nr:hypothetical protein [Rhizobium mongolense]MBB4226352.1 hypothetical protein [Rhizobium mongolense]TVZ73631.1 hypothetical protein BCL32_1879 [Rhizobium mongolense USDA 1844]